MVGGLTPPPATDEEAAVKALKQSVIFVLEDANLEVAKVGKTMQLLNCDDHANFLRRNNKDPARCRPDICHQALLAILDSPLNKAGRVKAVYVRTSGNVLIQISPHVRLPRTFRRFCGLLAQLLQKLSIRSTNGPDKLLKIIKGPVTKCFPANCLRIGFSYNADELVDMHDKVKEFEEEQPIVFVVGAFAHGKIDAPYVDAELCISNYPLSAACALSRITNALERKWNIV